MGVLKAKVDGAWVEVGGVGVGVPPGGTTGQVLTKSSAADYATVWTSNPPILSNSTYLQGYKADGTTAQSLIGMTAADEISIGPSLAAGKQVFVPRLTVQGTVTLQSQSPVIASNGFECILPWVDKIAYARNADAWFNEDAGLTDFRRNVFIRGDLQVTGGIAKTGVGWYTFPDFVFEREYTGTIQRFADAPGAADYEGLWPLERVEAYAREHWRLPHHAPREDDRVDIFRRTHDLLAELERVYLHVFSLNRRVKELEAR